MNVLKSSVIIFLIFIGSAQAITPADSLKKNHNFKAKIFFLKEDNLKKKPLRHIRLLSGSDSTIRVRLKSGIISEIPVEKIDRIVFKKVSKTDKLIFWSLTFVGLIIGFIYGFSAVADFGVGLFKVLGVFFLSLGGLGYGMLFGLIYVLLKKHLTRKQIIWKGNKTIYQKEKSKLLLYQIK